MKKELIELRIGSNHQNQMDEHTLHFINKVSNILRMLPDEQSLLLSIRYLKNNGKTFDYIVKDQLGVSERTYYRLKSEALSDFYELYSC